MASRIGTGAYGYALACNRVSDGDDACTCEVDSLAAGEEFHFFEFDLAAGTETSVPVTVRSDGTFEVELRPGVEYSLDATARNSRGEELMGALVLEEGELRFLAMTVTVTC